jgi:hypothetical protein
LGHPWLVNQRLVAANMFFSQEKASWRLGYLNGINLCGSSRELSSAKKDEER